MPDPIILGLPSDLTTACVAASECARLTDALVLVATDKANAPETDAEWALSAANKLCEALDYASGPVASVAMRLAASSPAGIITFAGFCESSYHVLALEIGFRLLNNARLVAGSGAIFPVACRPNGPHDFLGRLRLWPDVLKRVSASGFDLIAQKWADVREDWTATFSSFRGPPLISLIQQEAARAACLSFPPAKPSAPTSPAGKRKRKRKTASSPVPLTPEQTEAVHLVGEHKGDFTAAGMAAGKTRQAITKLYKKAMKKLGRTAPSRTPKTQALPTDGRGGANVATPERE
jgi:hypothetical protein